MNITPIESLMHHRPNCNCDACARNLKPFRAGRFVDKEEMDSIQAHVQELAKENERLSALLVQVQKRDEERAEQQRLEQQRQILEKLEQQRIEARRKEEESDDEEMPKARKRGAQSMTIVVDNTKLVYIGIMIVVLLMVLKK